MIEDQYNFHVVLTLHNSRTSSRMMKYNISKASCVPLVLDEQKLLARIIGNIITDSGFCCRAFNICGDHVHMILQCEAEELTKQVQKIKSISSKLFNRQNLHVKRKRLWTQKFFSKSMDEIQLGEFSKRSGGLFKPTYTQNTMSYIMYNREKHGLEKSKELEEIISRFLYKEL